MTAAVRRFREAPAGWVPLPHPSWRIQGWLKRNRWFAKTVLPAVRAAVATTL